MKIILYRTPADSQSTLNHTILCTLGDILIAFWTKHSLILTDIDIILYQTLTDIHSKSHRTYSRWSHPDTGCNAILPKNIYLTITTDRKPWSWAFLFSVAPEVTICRDGERGRWEGGREGAVHTSPHFYTSSSVTEKPPKGGGGSDLALGGNFWRFRLFCYK